MIVKSTALSVKYSKIENIKKHYFLHEEILEDIFNEATVLPVPDNAPMEVPRIIVNTKNEHAQLSITPIAATIQIIYDNGYEFQWEKCEIYIKNLMKKVFIFLDSMTNNSYEYMGIVTTMLLDEYYGDVAHILANNLLKVDNENLYDINLKYTFTKNKEEYINISIQNTRIFDAQSNESIAGGLNEEYQVGQHIGVDVDINNRYAFNSQKDYKTTSQKIDDLLSTMTEVISDKLDVLIKKGVY